MVSTSIILLLCSIILFNVFVLPLGDVVSVEVFGQPIIILSSPEAVTDLFEKRSAIYSDRMHQVMMVDLYGPSLVHYKLLSSCSES